MEHSKVEDEDEEEEFPSFGNSQSDYDNVRQLNALIVILHSYPS